MTFSLLLLRQLVPDHSILAHITEKLLQTHKPVKRWVVAYSGGIDSSVLLHSLCTMNQRLKSPLPIVALHINHQLSPCAQQWQKHCEKNAQALNIAFEARQVAVVSSGQGIEAAARQARYEVFESFLLSGDCLLMGHHQQDQAETVLLRLFRGAGVRGLTAMPESRTIGFAHLLRPLLGITKTAIQYYANAHGITWVDDDSNAKDDFDRNFLRHHIFPLLQQRWQGLDTQLVKTTLRMQEAEAILYEVAEDDLAKAELRPARTGFSVNVNYLHQLSAARKNNLLRYWCELSGYTSPGADQITQIQRQFFSGIAVLSSACVSWAGIELRQFSGRLYLLKALPSFTIPAEPIAWDGRNTLSLGAGGTLQKIGCEDVNQAESTGVLLKPLPYLISWRQGGERCTPAQRQRSQTVKKLLQEFGLEAWLRDRVPLIYWQGELVAVGDLWVNKGYQVNGDPDAVCVRWVCEPV